MKMGNIRRRVEEAFNRPGDELSRLARFLRFQLELWRFCARRLRENNLMAMSAALSFRTIFAMIPIRLFGPILRLLRNSATSSPTANFTPAGSRRTSRCVMVPWVLSTVLCPATGLMV